MPLENINNNDNPEKDEDFYQGVGSFLLEISKVFILALVIIIPIRVFLFQPFFVQGDSMYPNFKDSQYLIVNELGYKNSEIKIGNTNLVTVSPFKELERGDVVVFRYPNNPKQFFIKRIIGLPGEIVEIRGGRVYIKSGDLEFVLEEKEYLKNVVITKAHSNVPVALKEDEYFVMGDNRSASSDSRSWGPVNKNDVIGKVLLRAWPLEDVRLFFDGVDY